MSDIRTLSDAATAAPWKMDYLSAGAFTAGNDGGPGRVIFRGARSPADAALIVALRNGIADGSLVERADVDALKAAGAQMYDVLEAASFEDHNDAYAASDASHAWDAALDRIGGAR